MSQLQLIVTCEHGGNQVPEKFLAYFHHYEKMLKSHRGYDPGALELARDFAKEFSAPLFFSQISRLLIELNRSKQSKNLFSPITRNFSLEEKKEVIRDYYDPYRSRVERAVSKSISKGLKVIHLSVHTFTPVFQGNERLADIGFLYDSRVDEEKKICGVWKQIIKPLQENFIIRCNYPYLGKSDGFTTFLRSKYSAKRYLGIEIEVNQKFPLCQQEKWKILKNILLKSFQEVKLKIGDL